MVVRRSLFRKPRFADHEAFLRFAKEETRAKTYLEIGVETGRTLFAAGPHQRLAVGVDPAFKIVTPSEQAVRVALFRKTSDAFFADGDYRKVTSAPVDLTFVDGLHWCEFALRDVLNAERLSRRRSVILMHDIVPGNEAEAARRRRTGNWMGDVFKTALALKKFRPDLEVTCIGDISPSGMAVITNLSPRARPIDMVGAEAYMKSIDYARDFKRLMGPLLVKSSSAEAKRLFRPR